MYIFVLYRHQLLRQKRSKLEKSFVTWSVEIIVIDPLSPNKDFIVAFIFMDNEETNEFSTILNYLLSND